MNRVKLASCCQVPADMGRPTLFPLIKGSGSLEATPGTGSVPAAKDKGLWDPPALL